MNTELEIIKEFAIKIGELESIIKYYRAENESLENKVKELDSIIIELEEEAKGVDK